ncbi:hypothetical protein E4T56_gene18774 [Termitomyces sp. T112]|nr:hypothetical protein E4T56_gene18774 [Termitomyces sp. T112]
MTAKTTSNAPSEASTRFSRSLPAVTRSRAPSSRSPNATPMPQPASAARRSSLISSRRTIPVPVPKPPAPPPRPPPSAAGSARTTRTTSVYVTHTTPGPAPTSSSLKTASPTISFTSPSPRAKLRATTTPQSTPPGMNLTSTSTSNGSVLNNSTTLRSTPSKKSSLPGVPRSQQGVLADSDSLAMTNGSGAMQAFSSWGGETDDMDMELLTDFNDGEVDEEVRKSIILIS